MELSSYLIPLLNNKFENGRENVVLFIHRVPPPSATPVSLWLALRKISNSFQIIKISRLRDSRLRDETAENFIPVLSRNSLSTARRKIDWRVFKRDFQLYASLNIYVQPFLPLLLPFVRLVIIFPNRFNRDPAKSPWCSFLVQRMVATAVSAIGEKHNFHWKLYTVLIYSIVGGISAEALPDKNGGDHLWTQRDEQPKYSFF